MHTMLIWMHGCRNMHNIVACTDVVTRTADMTIMDAGNVLKATSSTSLPTQCLGHRPDMPVADGSMQDQ